MGVHHPNLRHHTEEWVPITVLPKNNPNLTKNPRKSYQTPQNEILPNPPKTLKKIQMIRNVTIKAPRTYEKTPNLTKPPPPRISPKKPETLWGGEVGKSWGGGHNSVRIGGSFTPPPTTADPQEMFCTRHMGSIGVDNKTRSDAMIFPRREPCNFHFTDDEYSFPHLNNMWWCGITSPCPLHPLPEIVTML